MNKYQIAYTNAKAALDAANKIAETRLAAIEYLLDQETQEACTEYSNMCVVIETELNIVELITIKRAAEMEMINWMIETVSKSKEYTAKYQNMTTEILGNLNNLTIRKMVIDLALQLG